MGNNHTHDSSCETLGATIYSQYERGGHLLKTLYPTGTNSLDQWRNKTFKGQQDQQRTQPMGAMSNFEDVSQQNIIP